MALKRLVTQPLNLKPLWAWGLRKNPPIECPPFGLTPLKGFVIFALILIARSPAFLMNPAFYFEDGSKFYPQAFAHGWSSLAITHAGYLHTLPRIIAVAAVQLPLTLGPYALAWSSVFIEAACAAFLLSNRLSNQGPALYRFILGLSIVLYANAGELYGNVTHLQWYLAIFGVALLAAQPPPKLVAKTWEVFLAALISATGPFALPLSPFAIWRAIRAKTGYAWAIAVAMAVGASLQATMLLTQPRAEGFVAKGKEHLETVVGMITGQVTTGALMGTESIGPYSIYTDFQQCAFAAATLGLLGWGLVKGPNLLKGVIGLGFFAFITALRSGNTWFGLATPGEGERYFFLLGLGVLWSVGWYLLATRLNFTRLFASLICLTWAYYALVGFHIAKSEGVKLAQYQLELDRTGKATIPTQPGRWKMELGSNQPD